MGGLILCRTKESAIPFTLTGLSVKIYSLEELCYYIYNNIYIVSCEMIDERLISFIEKELDEKILADRLTQLINKKAGLAEIVVTILKYVDYYSISEIEQLRGVLNTLGTQNVNERLKARADSFLENGFYYSAINNYRKIIEAKTDKALSGLFYARVYHNIGICYARMFLYRQAVPFFEEAYRIGRHEESWRLMLTAKRLAMGDNIIEREDMPEEEYVVKCELETVMDNARYSDSYRRLQELEKFREDGEITKYYSMIADVMSEWKEEYLKYTS